MAVVNIIKANIPLNGTVELPATVAITAPADGAIVPYDKADHKIVLIIKNNGGAEQTATIKKGNALQGVQDLVITLAAGKTHVAVIESGRFVNVSGTNKGKIQIIGSTTDIQVAAIALP